ncbi:MAG: hypothetical protein AABW45_01160 [Nanoarchaeota archaeon]
MNPKITMKFLEREFLPYSKNEPIRGYRRAIIETKTGSGLTELVEHKIGRVIEPDELAKAEFLDILLYQTELELITQKIDLNELIGSNQNDRKWLNSLKNYFKFLFKDEKIPLNFSIEMIEFSLLRYIKYPNDYFKRDWRDFFEGIIEKLPSNAYYPLILPPLKLSNGKRIPNLGYNRKVIRPDGIIEDYTIKTLDEKSKLGVILGKLNEKDIKDQRGIFEGGFPLDHFSEITYPTYFRFADRLNPLTIQVYLSKE